MYLRHSLLGAADRETDQILPAKSPRLERDVNSVVELDYAVLHWRALALLKENRTRQGASWCHVEARQQC